MEPVDRRDFMKSVAGATAFGSADFKVAESSDVALPKEARAVFLSTWGHGKPANERAAEVLRAGGSLLDAVERGINVPENDPSVMSVGYGDRKSTRLNSSHLTQSRMP